MSILLSSFIFFYVLGVFCFQVVDTERKDRDVLGRVLWVKFGKGIIFVCILLVYI